MKIAAFEVKNYETADFSAEKELEITLYPDNLTKDNVSLTQGCEGVTILGMSVIDAALMETLSGNGVKYLATRTVGYNHIDLSAARKYGIRVSNAQYEPNNVADFTVMLILMLLRKAKISVCRALVNDFSLDGMCGREMRNLTIGILGAGKIGRTVARNLSGFGCKILAYDPYVSPDSLPAAEFVPLDKLLQESDVVTLHMPLTAKTKHIINRERIAKMKQGALLVNTARGGLVHTQALIEALECGKIGGAGVDTLEEETNICHIDHRANVVNQRDLFYLKQFPNVIFTSHYAYFTQEATSAMVRSALDAFLCYRNGTENPFEVPLSEQTVL